jgi:mannose-1-phosphate guanylyltransferase
VVPADSDGRIELCGCRKAVHFVEKPGPAEARLLVAAGALWNTMIMVFKNKMLLGRVETLYPEVASLFRSLAGVISTPEEKGKVQQIYRDLRALNFSTDILEKIATRFPASISVLPVLQVTWSDWVAGHSVASRKPNAASSGDTHSATHLQQRPSPSPRSHDNVNLDKP